MQPRTLALVTALTLATLACAGGSDADRPDHAVPLTPPWTEEALPVDEGAVILSYDTTVAITYREGSPREHAARYADHFRQRGWREVHGDLDADMPAATFERDGHLVHLTAMQALGRTTVSLQRTDATP